MDKKNKVLENSFLYTFSSILVKAMGLFLLPIYTRFLTPEDYGITNLVNSFIDVATFIVAFSLYSAVVRFYADYNEDKEKLKRFYGTVITFVMISGTIMVTLGLIFRRGLILCFFKGISFYPVVFIALFTLMFFSLHMVHQNILQGMQMGKKLTLVNLIVFFLQVSLNLILIGVLKLGAVGILLSTLIINLGYCFFIIIDLKRNNLIKFCIDIDILKESLRYSIPLMPHNLSTHIASFASRVFLNTNGTLTSVGLYSVSSQFSAIIDTVQSSVNKAFAPWFYDLMNSGNNESKQEIVNFSNLLLILFSLLYLIIGLFSQEVIIMFTNKSYIMAWTAIPILTIAYSIKSIYYFYVNVLFYYKEASRKLFIATITGSFSDIILAYLMVPKYGMYGAAFSFLIAKIIVVAIVVVISKSHDDIGYRVTEMLKMIIPSLLFLGIGLYFSYTKYITEFNLGNLAYKLMVLVSYLIFICMTNRKMIIKFLQGRVIQNNLNSDNIEVKILRVFSSRFENLPVTFTGVFIKIYMFLINKIFKIKGNKVVFKSFCGRSYSDNPRAISEKLNKLHPEFEIVWLVNDPKKKRKIMPYYVKIVKAKSLSALRELATSKFWVDNFCTSYEYKSKSQIYIQTWHGDRGFKTIFYDSPYVSKDFKLFESKNCNLMVCGSDYGYKQYVTAFKYDGAILKLGCPRNDLLIENSKANKYLIRKSLNILENTNILLYAPTLRRDTAKGNKLQSIFDINLELIINALELKTNNKWICIVRAHSAVKGLEGISSYSEKIIDGTSYEEMAELLLISDFLITDYSSSAGDFALLNRPIILYQPDLFEYLKNDRSFYFDINSTPYMTAQNNEELLKIILNLNWNAIPQNCKDILDFYGTVETGEASKRVVEYIISQSKN